MHYVFTYNHAKVWGHAPPGNYTVSINVLATMDVKNCEGTQPLSTSKRSLNFLTLFLDFTLTPNTLFTYSRTSPGEGEGRGSDHHSRVSDLLVYVHGTEYLSSFSQITILKTSSNRPSLPVAYKSFDCIPYLSRG